MAKNIRINERGGLTLPKALRKKLGIGKGGVIITESTPGGIILKPAVAFPIEIYSNERMAEFDNEDKKLRKFIRFG